MRSRLGRSLAFIAAVLVVTTAVHDASAYCFSTTCNATADAPCHTQQGPECRVTRWKSGCVGFSVEEDGSPSLRPGDVEYAISAAFATWRQASCEGGPPGIVITDLGSVECDRVEYNTTAGNANIVVVRSVWPDGLTKESTIALTTTTFATDTGELLDADMEINSEYFTFVLDGGENPGDVDLLSVVTHETGHFLGLAHSQEPVTGEDNETDPTMAPAYPGPGSQEMQSLAFDDIAAICDLYPASDSLDEACNPLPNHGFSPYCNPSIGDILAEVPVEGGCHLSGSRRTTSGVSAMAALAAAGVLSRLRGNRRRARE